jgi:maltose alpha-D-glucosyltransferase/alpha-amylase
MRRYPTWLNTAVFYEIYPQTFADSNADGIGDIPGIIGKLDYLQSLGVNAVWLNPCFESPFRDAGYDVTDFYKVAPRYGTNADLERLFAEAKKRGIRVILDLVAGHVSLENAWFRESCKPDKNKHSDWFIWTDNPWQWDVPGFHVVHGYADRNGNFLTNFFWSQPALNYGFARTDPREPWRQGVDEPGPRAVRAELRSIMDFWLKAGCSGFRVDMAGSLVKDDPGQEATSAIWREIRAWLDESYPEAVLVSEWSNPAVAMAKAGFHMDFLLHFGNPAYSSLFRRASYSGEGADPYGISYFDRSGAGNLRLFFDYFLKQEEATRGFGIIALPSGNHDMGNRLGDGREAEDLALCYLLMLTLPTVPFIYYGDEIGMRSQGLPSKEGGYGRTGCRAPMQWDLSPKGGFSEADPESFYLPLEPERGNRAVSAQEGMSASPLNQLRALVALRRKDAALSAQAEFRLLHAKPGNPLLVYERAMDGERLVVAINPSDRAVSANLAEELPGGGEAPLLYLSGAGSFRAGRVELGPVSGFIAKAQGA